MPRTHATFTVLGSDGEASLDLGTAIVKLADRYREALAVTLKANSVRTDAVDAEVVRVAQLFGLATASGLRAPESSPHIFNAEVAQTEIDCTLAQASVAGPNEDIDRKYFGDNGRTLMQPESVRQQLGEAAWGEYSGMLGRYVARSSSLIDVAGVFSETFSNIVSNNHRK